MVRSRKSRSTLGALVFLILLGSTSAVAQTTLYVSPEGNDAWTGDAAVKGPERKGPFATIQGAQKELRERKLRGELELPATVYLRGGYYHLPERVHFTGEDSGEPGAPIIYKNYAGETPIISGGKKISGWQVYRDGLWFVDLPEVRSGKWNFDQLYVEGDRRQRARSPNNGYYYIEGLPDGTDFMTGTDRFQYQAGDIDGSWSNLTDVEIVILHHWFDVHRRIRSVDTANRIVNLEHGTFRNLIEQGGQPARYFVEGVFEALDMPGEWYLDRRQGRLFYYPMPGEDLSTANIFAPVLTEHIVLEGTPGSPVENLSFEGLRFEHNQWDRNSFEYPWQDLFSHSAAIVMLYSRNIGITGCTFRNLGAYAIDIWFGSSNNTISGNLMEHLGSGGVRVSGAETGEDPAAQTTRTTIVDNVIRYAGELNSSARGIVLMHTSGNYIGHNEIAYLRYHGIQVGWNWRWGPTETHDNVIEQNHIHHIGFERDSLSDLGAIYMNSEMPGTIVRNNLIHDIQAAYTLGFGIYLDGYSSHIEVTGNVVLDTQSGAFLQHFGKDNMLANNVFTGGRESQIHVGNGSRSENLFVERNIVLWQESPLLDGDVAASHIRFARNTYHRLDGETVQFGGETLEQWRQRGQDLESVIGDPLVRLNGKRFSIDPSSPALDLGFQPIDLSAVGPRVSEKPLVPAYHSGDANADGQVNVGDIFYLVNHLFADGPAPTGSGDANSDGTVSVGDVFYLINLIFGQTSANASLTTSSLTGSEGASIILGDPTIVGDEMIVPVRLDLRAQTLISSLALGIQVPVGSRVESITIERSGAARSAPVRFEATPSTTNEAAWIVSFDEPVTIRKDEPEVALIRLRLDRSESNAVMPSVTMNPRLTVVGVHSDTTSPNRPMPIPPAVRASR